jgi:penicillin-binding protein 1A
MRPKSISKTKSKKTPVAKVRKRKKKWKFKTFFKRFFKGATVVAIWGVISILAGVIYFSHDLPDVSTLGVVEKNRKVTLVNKNGEIITDFGNLQGKYITFDKLPKHLVNALLATEDRRFFRHWGVDPIGLIRAFYVNYKSGRIVQGGSTITQQLAKVAFLSSARTIRRKIQELILSFYLETALTKEQILTAYLNRVYLGSGIYGIDSAAKYYFGREVENLNIIESAIIVGLLKAPTRYSPIANTERSGERAYQILLNMQDAGYLTESELDKANSEPVILHAFSAKNLKHTYFASWVLDQINTMIADDGTNLIVKTTLNKNLQRIAESSAKKTMDEYAELKNVSQAAMVVLDHDGGVLAMLGGMDYFKSPFNRVTQAKRQPGSAFKHVVYLAALESGIGPGEIINDKPIKIKNWEPRNSTRKFYGRVSVEEAFARSINTVAVRLSERVGRNNVIKMAKRIGISSPIYPHPSIALGSSEVTLLELVGSYTVIANGGYTVEPHGIIDIKTESGKLLYRKSLLKRKVIPEKVVKDMKKMLISTIESGSGRWAKVGRPAAGKTGTSQGYRDALFVGFTADYIAGVWLGNDNNAPMKSVGGSSLPAFIWKNFMRDASVGLPKRGL